mgnify:CR=1 FL=1
MIHIESADMQYIDSCAEILQNSDLGKAYFSDYGKATNMLAYAVEQKNVYVALDENEKCLGFIYYMKNGVFGSYPYLHIVAVKEAYRSKGIGKQLIKYFEDNASDYSSTKYFLTVDDFDLEAGQYIVRWTSVLSQRFDSTAFKKVMPEIYKAYTKPVSSRRFTVSV